MEQETNICNSCRIEKQIKAFVKRKDTKKGIRNICKACMYKKVSERESKICGVYKITSPSEKIYIGESTNINRRKSFYKRASCKEQKKLYNSIKKYGWENHIFEIIEECSEEDLKCRERYWQDFYDVLGKRGLNLKLTKCGDKKAFFSKESREKIGKATKERGGLIGEANGMYGKIHTEEAKRKMSEDRKGEKSVHFGVKKSQAQRDAMSKTKKERGSVRRGNHPQAKIVIDTQTGVFFLCISDASDAYNINLNSLSGYLSGKTYNPTNLAYVSKDSSIITYDTKPRVVYKRVINKQTGKIYKSTKKSSEEENIPIHTLKNMLSNPNSLFEYWIPKI